jgi:hypothetical protein
VGSTVVFDERTALELIRNAEVEGIAVTGIDQLRPRDADGYEPVRGSSLRHAERLSSWRQASLFVDSLSSRGLYFDVVLESRWATWWAQVRWQMGKWPAT